MIVSALTRLARRAVLRSISNRPVQRLGPSNSARFSFVDTEWVLRLGGVGCHSAVAIEHTRFRTFEHSSFWHVGLPRPVTVILDRMGRFSVTACDVFLSSPIICTALRRDEGRKEAHLNSDCRPDANTCKSGRLWRQHNRSRKRR
jgi:hypothetical protein